MKSFFLLFCLFPAILFGDLVETFFGALEVNEPVLLEIIKSPSFNRLKQIHQYGISYYSGSHQEEYTRYDHSLGVFAILRIKGRPLEEQVAGLLHDVSHTVFSHVGDWVFGEENKEKDYQNSIHLNFLRRTELAEILSKHGLSIERMLPIEEYYPALEQPLPNLCADRIDYNIQGAYLKEFITKEEAQRLLDDLQFVDGHWVCTNAKLMEKVVRFSLFMTKNCWGSAENDLTSRWLADALLKGVEIELISNEELHHGTDDDVWEKLVHSNDPFIKQRLKAISQRDELYQVLPKQGKSDCVIKGKFRGIDPLVRTKGKPVRITSLKPRLAKEYLRDKKVMKKGWHVKILPGFPVNKLESNSLKKSSETLHLKNRKSA